MATRTRKASAKSTTRKPAARKKAAAPRRARLLTDTPTDPLQRRAGFLEQELGESTTHYQVVTARLVELEEEIGELKGELASLRARLEQEREAHASTRKRAVDLEVELNERNRRLEALAKLGKQK
jgi:predicted  nucleic acid-binding Zn-ribbon protein